VSADADEIVVDNTLRVLGHSDHEAASAGSAVDRSLQIVLVSSLTIAGGVVCRQHSLNAIPYRSRDNRLVVSGVVRALELDFADVIPAAQHFVQVVDLKRLRGDLGRGTRTKASRSELCLQHGERPVTTGIGLECPTDMGRTFVIHFDGSNFSANMVESTDISIADRSTG